MKFEYGDMFHNVRYDLGFSDIKIRDKQQARCAKKLELFKKWVVFKDKSVLDIGCCEGYMSVEAWACGASYVLGIDNCPRYLRVAEKARKILEIPSQAMEFKLSKWEDMRRYKKYDKAFDIVLCLGFIHHMPIDIYTKELEKVCYFCKDILVLELRISDVDISGASVATWYKPGSPDNRLTVPTVSWLRDKLESLGFGVQVRNYIVKGKREVWVAKRGKWK